MKHSKWFRIALVLLATVGALVMTPPTLANPIVPVELWTLAEPADPQPDLVLAYNSERARANQERRDQEIATNKE